MGNAYILLKSKQELFEKKLLESYLVNILNKIELSYTTKQIMEMFTLKQYINFIMETENKEIRNKSSLLYELLPQYAMKYNPEKVREWFNI